MALSVTLTGGSPMVSYRLPSASLTIIYERSPLQAPLPGGDPLLIDLGQIRPMIQIDGVVTTSSINDGGVLTPTKRNLEDAAELWWNTTITLDIINGPNTDSYTVKFRALRLTLPAARSDVWEYQLQFVGMTRT